jgi:hypothetical protein
MIPRAMAVRLVLQEDAWGCGLAVLAMLTGQTYAQVRDAFPGRDFSGAGEHRGMVPHDLDYFLSREGYATAARWHSWYLPPRSRWLPEPFAAVHYAQVDTLDGAGCHFVVVLDDGTVLDPATPSPRRLDDFPDVHCLAAVVRCADADPGARAGIPAAGGFAPASDSAPSIAGGKQEAAPGPSAARAPLSAEAAARLCGTSPAVLAFLVDVGALDAAGTDEDGAPLVSARDLRRIDFGHIDPEELARLARERLPAACGTHALGYLARLRSTARRIPATD